MKSTQLVAIAVSSIVLLSCCGLCGGCGGCRSERPPATQPPSTETSAPGEPPATDAADEKPIFTLARWKQLSTRQKVELTERFARTLNRQFAPQEVEARSDEYIKMLDELAAKMSDDKSDIAEFVALHEAMLQSSQK